MGSFIDTILDRAQADKQVIVLPEGDDERTLQAAETILAKNV
ncbi:MAG: phosphate acyltransferase, partial [Raoultibacter sp.]